MTIDANRRHLAVLVPQSETLREAARMFVSIQALSGYPIVVFVYYSNGTHTVSR